MISSPTKTTAPAFSGSKRVTNVPVVSCYELGVGLGLEKCDHESNEPIVAQYSTQQILPIGLGGTAVKKVGSEASTARAARCSSSKRTAEGPSWGCVFCISPSLLPLHASSFPVFSPFPVTVERLDDTHLSRTFRRSLLTASP